MVSEGPQAEVVGRKELVNHIKIRREEMIKAAADLDFETAAQIRDEVFRLEKLDLELR